MLAMKLLARHRRNRKQMETYCTDHPDEAVIAVHLIVRFIGILKWDITYFKYVVRRFMTAVRVLQRYVRNLRARKEAHMARIVDVNMTSTFPGFSAKLSRSLVYDVVYDEYSKQNHEHIRRWTKWRQRCRYYEHLGVSQEQQHLFLTKEPVFHFEVNTEELRLKMYKRAEAVRLHKIVSAMASLGIRTNDLDYVRKIAREVEGITGGGDRYHHHMSARGGGGGYREKSMRYILARANSPEFEHFNETPRRKKHNPAAVFRSQYLLQQQQQQTTPFGFPQPPSSPRNNQSRNHNRNPLWRRGAAPKSDPSASLFLKKLKINHDGFGGGGGNSEDEEGEDDEDGTSVADNHNQKMAFLRRRVTIVSPRSNSTVHDSPSAPSGTPSPLKGGIEMPSSPPQSLLRGRRTPIQPF